MPKAPQKIDTAIILVGGQGSRFGSETEKTPKPLLDVGGRPIIDYQIDLLKEHGFERIIFACHHGASAIQKHIGDGSKFGMVVDYSIESTPLKTGGGIRQAMEMLKPGFGEVLVSNGDILTNFPVDELIKTHFQKKALATMALVQPRLPWGVVKLSEDGYITGFKEKPVIEEYINGGFYIFGEEVLSMLPEREDIEITTFLKLAEMNHAMAAYMIPHQCYWLAIDTKKDWQKSEADVRGGIYQLPPRRLVMQRAAVNQ